MAYHKQVYWPKNSSKCLNKQGYRQSKLVPGFWKHNTGPIQFTLVVNNFGVKYISDEQAQNLKNALKEHYKLTCNWTGIPYIWITLNWDYKKYQVHLSMPNYLQKALKQFQHIAGKLQYAPYPSVPIQYGAKKQYAMQELKASLFEDKAKQFTQQVCGYFFIPWQSSRHPPLPNQRHSIPIIQTD
jgi:hypothetical protein